MKNGINSRLCRAMSLQNVLYSSLTPKLTLMFETMLLEISILKKMMELTNQEAEGWVVNWFLNQIKLKNKVLKNFCFQGLYHKILLKLISNQSPIHNIPFLKFFSKRNFL